MKRRSLFAALLGVVTAPFVKAKSVHVQSLEKGDGYIAMGWIEIISKEKNWERVQPCEIPREWWWLDAEDLRKFMKQRYPQSRECKLTAIWPHEKIKDIDPRYYKRLT